MPYLVQSASSDNFAPGCRTRASATVQTIRSIATSERPHFCSSWLRKPKSKLALWAISGLSALVVGLRRDDRALRLGSLALLLVTVGKVFLYDLAALASLYRVGSFIGLGLLLLVAAGIWQRMRPQAPADLREVPPALR